MVESDSNRAKNIELNKLDNKKVFTISDQIHIQNNTDTNTNREPKQIKNQNITQSIGSQINSINLDDADEQSVGRCHVCSNRLKRFSKYATKFYGLFLALLTTIAIACSIFLVKLSISLNASDMALVKFGVQILFCIPFAYFYKENLLGPRDSRLLLFCRGLTGALSIIACYFSIKFINFSDSMTIRHSSPIITAIVACLFLNEKFHWIHLVSFLLSIGGILSIIRPTQIFGPYEQSCITETSLIIGVSLAGFGALTSGSTYVFIKKLTNTNIHFSIIVFYYSLIGFIISLIISSALFTTGYTHETWHLSKQYIFRDISIALLAGLINFFGHVCFTLAISRNNANKIALLRSMDIIVAFLLDFYILKTSISWFSILGACLILLGAFIIFIYKLVLLRKNRESYKSTNSLFRI